MLPPPFLTPAETKISVLLSASVETFGVYRKRDIFVFILLYFFFRQGGGQKFLVSLGGGGGGGGYTTPKMRV